MSDKLAILTKRLVAATSTGTVDWKKGIKSRAFVVSFPNYSIALSPEDVETEFGSENQEISISIFNEMGELVEKAYPWELQALGVYDASRVLNKLYESARRRAMGVDAALDSILAELPSVSDEDDEVPF